MRYQTELRAKLLLAAVMQLLLLVPAAPPGVAAQPAQAGEKATPQAASAAAGAVANIPAKIDRGAAYVRYRPNGAAFDYFMRNDSVRVHYKSYNGYWMCVTGTTRFGLSHTGWVGRVALDLSSKDLKKVPAHTNQESPCQTTHNGGAPVAYPPRKVKNGTPLLHGPAAPGARNPVISKFSPGDEVGVAGGPRCSGRGPQKGYVWVSRKVNSNCGVAPGKTGWVKLSDLQ
jgi:hypothetical protein